MIGKIILILAVIASAVAADMLIVKSCVKTTVEALKITEEQNNN